MDELLQLRSILKSRANPHLHEEQQNITVSTTLNVRLQEALAWRQDLERMRASNESLTMDNVDGDGGSRDYSQQLLHLSQQLDRSLSIFSSDDDHESSSDANLSETESVLVSAHRRQKVTPIVMNVANSTKKNKNKNKYRGKRTASKIK